MDIPATSDNIPGTLVLRDANGSFSTSGILAGSAVTADNLAGGTANSIPYQSAADTTVMLAAGSAGQVLTSNGASTAPSWQTLAATATNADNITGGNAGEVLYQSSAGVTEKVAAGTSGQALTSNGSSAPSWLTLAASATTNTTNASNITSGTLNIARIANDAVTNAKLRNSAALSIIGRSANSTGDPADIAAGTDGHVLRRSGTTLGFGTIANSATTATNANTADAIVARDSNGDFSAGIITATGIAVGQFTDATTVNAADELIVQQSGVTKRATGAELAKGLNAINGTVNVKDFGAVGDGVADDTAAIQAALNAAANKTVVLESGATYLISSELQMNNNCILTTSGSGHAVLQTTTNSGIAVDIGGNITVAATTTLAANVPINSNNLEVANNAGMDPGRLIHLTSTKSWYHDPREVSGITPSSDATGTAQGGTSSTITLKASTTATNFANRAVTIMSGTGAGQARVVSSYADATKVATVSTNWSVAPDNTSVYRFAQLFKGELHLIRSVSGDTIYLDEYTFDGYDVVDDAYGDYKEDVTIHAYDPITVTVENVYVKRPPALNANSYGFRLIYGKNCVLRNCRVDYGQVAGVSISTSYNTLMEGCEVNNANDTTTGYGSQSSSAFRSVYRNNRFLNCRRGIDFSGTTPSRLGIAESNQVFAGGLQEDGAQYEPNGTVGSFGMGSHGTAEGTIYRNNVIGNVGRGINLRGRNELILNNKIIGRVNRGIDLSHGMNHVIRGNYYHNQFAEGTTPEANLKTEANPFAAGSILSQSCPHFIFIQSSYQEGFTHIEQNVCRDLSRYFIYFSSGARSVKDMFVANNVARINPVSTGDDCGLFGASSATHSLERCFIENNTLEGPDSVTNIRYFASGVSINSTAAVVNTLSATKTFTTFLNNDSVAKVRTFFSGDRLLIALMCQNSSVNRFFGQLAASNATLVSMGSSNDVAGLATEPTGTSGSVGNITLHYDGKFIFIENRAGGSRDVYLTVFPTD